MVSEDFHLAKRRVATVQGETGVAVEGGPAERSNGGVGPGDDRALEYSEQRVVRPAACLKLGPSGIGMIEQVEELARLGTPGEGERVFTTGWQAGEVERDR